MEKHEDICLLPFQHGKALQKLKEIFVITTIDKASHNLALVCKHWYLYKLSKELSNPAYQLVTVETLEQILKRHAKWNELHGYEEEQIGVRPYLYANPNLHKLLLLCHSLVEFHCPNHQKEKRNKTSSQYLDASLTKLTTVQQLLLFL